MTQQSTPTILTRILARKDQEVAERRQAVSEAGFTALESSRARRVVLLRPSIRASLLGMLPLSPK